MNPNDLKCDNFMYKNQYYMKKKNVCCLEKEIENVHFNRLFWK